MYQINREIIEDSLKSFYCENWRRAVLTHILTGIGTIIKEIIEPESPESKKELSEYFDDEEIERFKPMRDLEEHPLEYIQAVDEKIACEVASQLSHILRIAFGGDIRWAFPDNGLLFTTIATEAFDRLWGEPKDKLSRSAEKFVRKSWAIVHPTVREGILRIIRLLSIILPSDDKTTYSPSEAKPSTNQCSPSASKQSRVRTGHVICLMDRKPALFST